MNFSFAQPSVLVLLLLLPCFVWCRTLGREYYFAKLEWLGRQSVFWSFEPWLKMALFALMVFALAKPFVYDTKVQNHKKGRDLVLALDASGSMGQSGFDSNDRFKNKFDINIELAKDFISKRHDDNMALVIFGTFAYSASPLTYDLEALAFLLDMTNVGLAGESTALGDAIMRSIDALAYGEAKNKVVILLSDGYHNAGESSPKQAVARAKKQGIKVYTIGIGKKSNYDSALLKAIARQTGARSYAASSSEDLAKIYESIADLEPSPLRSENYLNQRLLIMYPLGLVFVLLLLWVLYARRLER